jgi:hypothetical protein
MTVRLAGSGLVGFVRESGPAFSCRRAPLFATAQTGSLSASVATTPFNVTFPFLTMM